MESFWVRRKRIAIETQYERAINAARCNPDYQRKYPQEHKSNPECKILKACHPDAKKRIEKEMLIKQRSSVIPTVERPKRMNRQ